MFCLIGWLNFILKEWLTISRGAEPSAQKAKLENRNRITENKSKDNDNKTLLKRVLEVVAKKAIQKLVYFGTEVRGPEINHFCSLLYHIYIYIYR